MHMKFSANVMDLTSLQNFVFFLELIHVAIMNLLPMKLGSFSPEMITKVTIGIFFSIFDLNTGLTPLMVGNS